MSNWKVIRPAAFTNLITNPSMELGTTGYSAGASATVGKSVDNSLFGSASLEMTRTGAGTSHVTGPTVTVADAQQYLSLWIYIDTGWTGGAVTLASSAFTSAVEDVTTNASTSTTAEWVKLWLLFTPDSGDLIGTFTLTSASPASSPETFQVDGVMMGTASLEQTYVDGDQPEGVWNGAAHASTSYRIETDRNGGEILDLESDLYYVVTREMGTGVMPVKNSFHKQAQQGGAIFTNAHLETRNIVFPGAFNAGQDYSASVTNFHSRRQALLKLFYPRTGQLIDEQQLPVSMRYVGAADDKEIRVYYDGGLNDGPLGSGVSDPETLRLLATDPFFYGVGQKSTVLDTQDSATFRIVARRIGRAQNIGTDVWDNLGPPDAAGGGQDLYTIAEDGTYIYLGGAITNWDNQGGNFDYIVRWDKVAETYSAMGTGGDATVRKIKVHPNGDVYAAGQFTNMGGVVCRGVARWDGSTWNALGPPSAGGNVTGLEIDNEGNVYVIGSFTNWDGIAAADYVAKWDGSSWSALGAAATGGTMSDGAIFGDYLYVVGSFTAVDGGTSASKIARWDLVNDAWEVVHSSTIDNNAVNEIIFDSLGNFYIGGSFTTIDSDSDFSYIAHFNDQAFVSLDGGMNGQVVGLALDDKDTLYAGGNFTTAGTLTLLNDRLAQWNGSAWAPMDINFDGNSEVNAFHFSPESRDLYVVTDSVGAGTGTYSGDTTINYTGSAEAYPTITFERSGGTSATLVSLRNETTGANIYLNYPLQDGEKLTLATNPFAGVSVTSTARLDANYAILQGSDIGGFFLTPSNTAAGQDNIITAYVDTAGSPTVTATMFWRDTFLSQD